MKNKLLLASLFVANLSVVAEEAVVDQNNAAETTQAAQETVVDQDPIVAFVTKNFQGDVAENVATVKKAIANGVVADLNLTEEQLYELSAIISKQVAENTIEDTITN